MIIPINTDAPIYHWPWMTLTLIVINLFTFAITGGGFGSTADAWMLEYGSGLNPIEWLSCNFLHFGIMHLIGNMIFLWGFGIIVEGKIGWWSYLLVYFGIGIAHAAIEQVMMLGYAGQVEGAGGASGVIFGLLAISLVWAPKNEITCLFIFILRVFTFDVTILTFSIYYIGMQILFALVQGFQMSSEMIHLLGALCGLGVGLTMLKLDWVDCENWDLLAVMSNTYGNRDHYQTSPFYNDTAAIVSPVTTAATTDNETDKPKKKRRRRTSKSYLQDLPTEKVQFREVKSPQEEAKPSRSPAKKRLSRIRRLIQAEKPAEALREYRKFVHRNGKKQLKQDDLRGLIEGLYKSRAWSDVGPLLQEYIRRFSSDADRERLMLAGILLQEHNRPKAALKILVPIEKDGLSAKLQKHRQALRQKAQQMIDDGHIELEDSSL